MTVDMRDPATRYEHRFDVLRNSADLYGSIYHVILTLASYRGEDGDLPGYNQARDLCRIAGKIAPHLPKPAEGANVW